MSVQVSLHASDEDVVDAPMPPSTSHHPLGSWERHLMDERLRALKDGERHRRQQEALRRSCPFQPRVAPTPPGSESGEAVARAPVFERLSREAQERASRRAQQAAAQRQREAALLQDAFRPRVNAPPETCRSAMARAATLPVEERLLHYGRAIAEGRRRAQAERAAAERTPTSTGPVADADAMMDRSRRFLLEREAARARAALAQLEAHSFRPRVCRASRAMDRRALAQQTVPAATRSERLYAAAARRQEKAKERAESPQHDARERRPATSPLTDAWILHGPHRALFAQDFVRRQQLYEQVRAEHQRGLALALAPQPGRAPRVEAGAIDAQVRRLYHAETAVRREARRRREERQQRECTFRPSLAPATPYVVARAGRERDVVKRLSMCPPPRRAEAEEAEEEETTGRVLRPAEAAAFYERQRRAVEAQEAERRAERQRRAMEEIGDCTFRPRTNADAAPRRSQSPVAECVSGVTAHLQRQQEARRRMREREAQMERLGKGMRCNGPGCTLITPFHLSSGRARARGVRHADPCNSEGWEEYGDEDDDVSDERHR